MRRNELRKGDASARPRPEGLDGLEGLGWATSRDLLRRTLPDWREPGKVRPFPGAPALALGKPSWRHELPGCRRGASRPAQRRETPSRRPYLGDVLSIALLWALPLLPKDALVFIRKSDGGKRGDPTKVPHLELSGQERVFSIGGIVCEATMTRDFIFAQDVILDPDTAKIIAIVRNGGVSRDGVQIAVLVGAHIYEMNGNLLGKLAAGDGSLPIAFKNLLSGNGAHHAERALRLDREGIGTARRQSAPGRAARSSARKQLPVALCAVRNGPPTTPPGRRVRARPFRPRTMATAATLVAVELRRLPRPYPMPTPALVLSTGLSTRNIVKSWAADHPRSQRACSSRL